MKKTSCIVRFVIRRYWGKKGNLKDTETGTSDTNKTSHSKMTKENPTKDKSCTKTNQQPDVKEGKHFGSKI